MANIKIDGREIGAEQPPYVIAELSANHNGSLGRALKIIEAAKDAGADAVKLQTYSPNTLTIDCDRPDFRINSGLWRGKTLHQLYEWAHMPWDWHAPLFAKAKSLGLTIFSSPFDTSAVDLLASLDAPAYKIASFELVDIALVRYVAKQGKPLILSTGMATEKEIQNAVTAARQAGCEDIVLLRCVSSYPADPEDYHLKTLPDMARKFRTLVGLSDHTLDNTTAIASVALGACVIEKHVTLDRQGDGPDDSFSLQPAELKQLCEQLHTTWRAIGKVNYGISESEASNLCFRRSLYVVADIAAGAHFTPHNVRSIRPGFGLAPIHYNAVIGRRAKSDLVRGTALSWDFIED